MPVLEAGARRIQRIAPVLPHPAAEPFPGPARTSGPASDPGVRWHRVMGARERMAAGYYDRRHIREWIADAVLLDLRRP